MDILKVAHDRFDIKTREQGDFQIGCIKENSETDAWRIWIAAGFILAVHIILSFIFRGQINPYIS